MRPKSCSNYTKLQNLQKNANFWSVEFRKQRVFSGMHKMGQKVHPLNSWFIILTRRKCFKIKWKVYHRHFLRFLVHFEAQNHAVHILYFYPRDGMQARVLAIALCPSVRLSVCHKSEFCRNGWTIELRVFFSWRLFSTYPKLCCKENSGIYKNKGRTPVRNWISCYRNRGCASSLIGFGVITVATVVTMGQRVFRVAR